MIMTLTGKALIHFQEFLYNKYDVLYNIEDYHETMLNAEIIECLDSVGIYIEIIRNNDYFDYVVMDDWDYGFDTRQEATKQAIKKANEIYNEKES